jgi:hypothetical protein
MIWKRCLALLSLLGMALPLWADVASGPPVGGKVAPLKVFDVTGKHKDKEVDYAAERKDQPTVYVFIHEWNRPVARFLRTLDEAIKQDFDKAYQVAVWLSEQPEQTKEYLPKAQQSLKLESTALTVFQGEKRGPDGWGINDMAHVTVVVVVKNKVAATFGLVSVNETDARPVRMALKKAIEGN